jgi:hypothetical protein
MFVGAGTPYAQESTAKPAVVEMRDTQASPVGLPTTNDRSGLKANEFEPSVPFRFTYVEGIAGDVGVPVAVPLPIQVDDPEDNNKGRQNSGASQASDAPEVKASTKRRWFAGATEWMLGFLARGIAVAVGR